MGLLLSFLITTSLFLFGNFANANLVSYGNAEYPNIDSKKPLNVLCWNVQKFQNSLSYHDIHRVIPEIDVLILQESMMHSTAEQFFNENLTGLETFGAISFKTREDGHTGVSTSARIQAVSTLPIRSIETEPILNTPKMILITEYKIKDSAQTLMVANIHGLNFVPNWKFASQLSQLEAKLSKHIGPILLAGDFNTHNWLRTEMLDQFAGRLKLNYVDMPNSKDLFILLDHILVRGLRSHDSGMLRRVTSSDHFPLWAELEFK